MSASPDAPLTGAARHVDRGGLLAIDWLCFGIATCFLTLRLAVRWRQNHKLLVDDYWMIWAWMCMLTMSILQTEQMDALWYMTYVAAGRIDAEPQEIKAQNMQMTRWQFPIIKLFWVTLWSIKASFLTLFFRLVQSFPVLRRLWYVVAVFTGLALIGCVLASTLTCDPPSDYFFGDCSSPKELWMQRFNVIYSTTVDIASDLMIMGLPISALPSLQLDRRKKIGLGVAFCLAVIIICVAIVRMTQIVVGATVDLVGLALWGAVETATAIVVGCLPPLKSLISRSVKRYQTKKSSNRKYGYHTEGADRYAHGTHSRPAVVSQSIPLDSMYRSGQFDGAIYVQKTFETAINRDNDSREDIDEATIVDRTRI